MKPVVEDVEELRRCNSYYEVPEKFAGMSHVGERGRRMQGLVEDSQEEKAKGNEDTRLPQAIPQTIAVRKV
jgi:hypothetical protein